MAEKPLKAADVLEIMKEAFSKGLGEESIAMSVEQLQKFADLGKQLKEDFEQIGEDAASIPEAVEEATDRLKEKIRENRRYMQDLKIKGEIDAKGEEMINKQTRAYEKQIKALKGFKKEQGRANKALSNQQKITKEVGDNLSRVFRDLAQGRKPSLQTAVSIGQGFKKLGFTLGKTTAITALFALGLALLLVSLYAVAKAIIGVIKNVIKLTLEVDKFSSSVRKATGTTREFTEVSTKAWRQTGIGIGVSADQAAQATRSLYKSYTEFSRLPAATRASVEKLSSTFLGLGMSTGQIAGNLEIMTKGFGMTSTQANYAFRELRAFSSAANIDFELMNEQFAAAGPLLTKYDDAIGTFKRLAAASKITGMEMDKITRIATQFDTFDAAAAQAGRLNAALGGNFVNAMELMMETDPVERFKMIRDSILDTGLAFSDMAYFQKQFYVGAIEGIDTTDDLKRLLTGTTQEIDNLAKASDVEAQSMAELKKIAFDMLPVMDKLGALFKSLFAEIDVEVFAKQINDFVSALVPLVEALSKAMAFSAKFTDLFNLEKLPGRVVGAVLPGGTGQIVRQIPDVAMKVMAHAGASRAAAGSAPTGTANQAALEKQPFEIPITLNGDQLATVAGEFIAREILGINILSGG